MRVGAAREGSAPHPTPPIPPHSLRAQTHQTQHSHARQADCLPDPGDVFVFLKENCIGQAHALYYIAYATYLEFKCALPPFF